MPDYYSLLERKIKETKGDRAKMRQVIYEAARLALKRQVMLHRPTIGIPEARRLLSDLEDAIARIEADAMVKDDVPEIVEPEDEESASANAERRGRRSTSDPVGAEDEPFDVEHDEATGPEDEQAAGIGDEGAASATYGPPGRRRGPAGRSRSNGVYAIAEPEEDEASQALAISDQRAHARKRVDEGLRAADRGRRGAPDKIDENGESDPLEQQLEEPKRSRNRFSERPDNRLRDLKRPASCELVLVPDRSISAPRAPAHSVHPHDFRRSLDVIVEVPGGMLPGGGPMLLSGFRILFQVTVASLAAVAFFMSMWQRQPAQNGPTATVPANVSTNTAPASSPGVAGEIASATTATDAVATPAPVFPHPSSYGIYAISNKQLIELEQIPTAPVDPRTRNTLQIVKPSRAVIAGDHLTFLVFRRDLIMSAPEKVQARIAARIAHSMIFDSSGKPQITTPATEAWLIRDRGYDLRVSPARESAEMIIVGPENPEFDFPAGRYELLISGQPYDFVIAGTVTDPAHCVEGFATVRGPVFYECKAQ
jgi:hypothetical protein